MSNSHIVEILDWLLLEGGDPSYENPYRPGDDVVLDDSIFEIRFPEFEVYVGPSTDPTIAGVDVAVLIRPAMPFDPETIRSLVVPLTSDLHERMEIEFHETEDGRPDTSLWLVLRLTTADLDSNGRTDLFATLMESARRLHRDVT